ncbi:hypothetical protein BKK79_00985 [Cupriavidus sp. USMAA2-4]|uniref:Rho termination factor N-terminal domain-containing protein n=1 Tax=Cupriavidus sp. USMAA2-4 TaxID=876364 RepID=UPI0008A70606|nr:Rho termination factor N-terminal domain-containing protein [Cupriavidus sp. USMAA2-4]AOY90560.1 hypothetical protein BKK79_00985 [Cupriavidus sp. USMAA2-4]
MIPIEYVGKKPWTRDNVAGSGKAWEGPGDVQEVCVNQARMLLKHPDQWALANPDDAALVDGPVMVAVTDPGTGEQTEVTQDSLAKPLEKMSKAELAAYAASIKLSLQPTLNKKQIIDAIELAEKGPDPLQAGVTP